MDKYFEYTRFYYRYLGNHIWLVLGASMVVALLDGIGLAMFLPLMQAVDGGQVAAASEDMGRMAFLLDAIVAVGISPTLMSILLVMLAFFLLKAVTKFLTDYYRILLQMRFINMLRGDSMRLLSNFEYSSFASADSGRMQNSFTGEIGGVMLSYVTYFRTFQNLMMLLVYVALAAVANPSFAAMVAVGGLLSNVAFKTLYAKTKASSRSLTRENNKFQGLLIQAVGSFKYLKATNLLQTYRKKVDRSIDAIESHQRYMGKMAAISTSLREPMVMLIVVVAILVQVVYLEQNLGLIILSLLFLYRGLNAMVFAQSAYNDFLGKIGSLENHRSFEETLVAGQESVGSVPYQRLAGEIKLADLSYTYEHGRVLDAINLTIKKKQTVGIVGSSGAGKTTLVNIICGLLRVERGMLTINGVDSNDLMMDQYRASIGYVTQEPQVFPDTISNNVCFWEPTTEAVKAKVRKALELAHADEFVDRLPQGADTVIGINGINLSGGQRQRISIARELYREVDLLILDEATSALDSQSEQLIQKNIDSLSGQYTMLVIAHRLSTVRNADTIIYLRPDGRYEVGTFDSLLVTSGTFKDMVHIQAIS